jgi:hypothetical protein
MTHQEDHYEANHCFTQANLALGPPRLDPDHSIRPHDLKWFDLGAEWAIYNWHFGTEDWLRLGKALPWGMTKAPVSSAWERLAKQIGPLDDGGAAPYI